MGLNYVHSIVRGDDNALNYQCKFFPLTMKNLLPNPSEIRALDFKGKFRRFKISSVSATVGIDRSTFQHPPQRTTIRIAAGKCRQRRCNDPLANDR